MMWKVPSDPFISHMRIAYEDNIRSSTEKFWRKTIALEFQDMPEIAERIVNERS